ncbi:hypothetical protein VNO78_11738 [Psophocarpus tetragonolobus]|uniref:Uncharacterized protein n=1 Tax=Psophocarpus tetragonolobus TaxID=3891 RepID=A0AAN9SM06_PSOTE
MPSLGRINHCSMPMGFNLNGKQKAQSVYLFLLQSAHSYLPPKPQSAIPPIRQLMPDTWMEPLRTSYIQLAIVYHYPTFALEECKVSHEISNPGIRIKINKQRRNTMS